MPRYEVECDVGTVTCEVLAPDVDEALRRAVEYALSAPLRAAVDRATFGVREIEADDVRL